MEEATRTYAHCAFVDIFNYLTSKKYPEKCLTKGDKANFRRCSKNFTIVENELKYLRKRKDGSTKEVTYDFLFSFSLLFIFIKVMLRNY